MSSKNKIDKIPIDEFKQLIDTNTNVIDILKKIGYKYPTSYYIELLLKRCAEIKIDYQHLNFNVAIEKPCVECGKIKPLSDFYNRRIVCKECVKKKEKIKQHERRDQVNEYKEELGCAKCGEKRYYLLDFHHVDPSQKDFTISDNTRIKFENLLKELKKCVVLCANCHREFHFLNSHQGISLDEYLKNRLLH